MNGEARHVVCPHCAGINRVPLAKPAQQGKCGRCHQPLFTGKPIAASAGSFVIHIQHDDIPVAVDFWARWCGPCRAMAPVFERLAAELEPEMRFLKVDTDAEQELSGKYGIRSIPTLMVFRKGEIVAQRAGAMDTRSLRAFLLPHVAQSATASTGA